MDALACLLPLEDIAAAAIMHQIVLCCSLVLMVGGGDRMRSGTLGGVAEVAQQVADLLQIVRRGAYRDNDDERQCYFDRVRGLLLSWGILPILYHRRPGEVNMVSI